MFVMFVDLLVAIPVRRRPVDLAGAILCGVNVYHRCPGGGVAIVLPFTLGGDGDDDLDN